MKKIKSKTKRTAKTRVTSVELRNIKLSKESRKSLGKIKEPIYGTVRHAIEGGLWMIPSETYEFIDIKTKFEEDIRGFFDIPENAVVEVDCFDTGILSFEKGIYPNYHK